MKLRTVPARDDGALRVASESGFVRRAPRVAMEQAIAAALDFMGEGVAVIDMETHRLLFVNGALCEILGQEPDDLMGLSSLEALVIRDDVATFRRSLREREDDTTSRGTFEVTVVHARAAAW